LHVGSLRRSGSGIAIIDEFTVARHAVPGIKAIGIDGENVFHTYVAYRRDLPLRVRADSAPGRFWPRAEELLPSSQREKADEALRSASDQFR
jgi:hypothetical protein